MTDEKKNKSEYHAVLEYILGVKDEPVGPPVNRPKTSFPVNKLREAAKSFNFTLPKDGEMIELKAIKGKEPPLTYEHRALKELQKAIEHIGAELAKEAAALAKAEKKKAVSADNVLKASGKA